MLTKEKTSVRYTEFVEYRGSDLLEKLHGVAVTSDIFSQIKDEEIVVKFAKGLAADAVNSWLSLKESAENGDDIIQIINSKELTAYIHKVLEFEYVTRIYEFCSESKYELWVMVNDNSFDSCKNIYADSLKLKNVDILVVETNQLDERSMPSPNFIFTKEKSKEK